MDLFSSIAELSWVRERNFLGVEAVAVEKGKWEFRAIQAKRKGNELEVQDRDKGGTSVEELKERFGSGMPIVLVISGKGVVHKPIAEDRTAMKDRMDQVLPNADPEAFYFQEYKDEEGCHWGSLVRREQVDELLSALGGSGFLVTSLMIGPFPVISYWGLFFGQQEEARFGPFELQKPSKGPLGLERSKEDHPYEVRIGEERFESPYILALGALFEELLKKGELLSPELHSVQEARREQDHKNLFQRAAVAAIAFFLILLLGNYFAYGTAASRLSGMKEELRMKEGLLQELEELEQEYASKKRTLDAVSAGSKAAFSFLADRLASKVPERVLLTRMELAPVTDKVEKGERIRTDQEKVLMEGRTTEGKPLNKMMREFKEYEWVAEASVLDYHQRERKEGANFELELKLR